jgi:hypothetical protein
MAGTQIPLQAGNNLDNPQLPVESKNGSDLRFNFGEDTKGIQERDQTLHVPLIVS